MVVLTIMKVIPRNTISVKEASFTEFESSKENSVEDAGDITKARFKDEGEKTTTVYNLVEDFQSGYLLT